MSLPSRIRIATRWVCVIGLHAAAFLTLQSCKNNQPEVSEGEQRRAVYGAPERVAPETRQRAAAKGGQARGAIDEPQERARQTEPVRPPVTPVSPTVASRSSPVGDPGERRVGDRGVAAAVTRRAGEQVPAERFLHYRPPGSSVGDGGELARSTVQAAPVSTKSVENLLRRWADTLVSGDLNSHMRLYAPAAQGGSGLASKRRLVSALAGVRRFEIFDVRLRQSTEGAVLAEFRVESDAANGRLAGRYRLALRKVDSEWKIFREEKFGR